MGTLKLKENIDMDKALISIGFTKARDYFHCGDISVRICDREIMHSITVPGLRHTSERRFNISKVILQMIEKGLVE